MKVKIEYEFKIYAFISELDFFPNGFVISLIG